MVNASKIINTITGSIQNETIRKQIPILSEANTLGVVWSVIDQNEDVYCAFAQALINRIAKVSFDDNTDWRDPIREFIGGGTETPLGYFEQQIGENPLSPHNFDPNDFTAILRRYGSDTKAVYYQRNYKRYFAITIDYDGLKEAFISDDAFLAFIRLKRNELKVSYELNSYNTFLEIICANYAGGAFIKKPLPSVITESDIEAFTIDINTYYDNFQFYSKDYNNYANIEGANGAYYTTTKPEDFIIIARSDIINTYMVKSLASAFNMSMAELKGKILKIPEFGFDVINGDTGQVLGHESTDIAFMICDRRLFHFVKNLDKYMEQSNAGNLTVNLFHHYWNTYGINPMANCVVFYQQTENEKYLDVQVAQPLIRQDVPAQVVVTGSEAATTNIIDPAGISVGNLNFEDFSEDSIKAIVNSLGFNEAFLTGNSTVADIVDAESIETINGGYKLNLTRSNTNLQTISELANMPEETAGYIEFKIHSAHSGGEQIAKLYFTVGADY